MASNDGDEAKQTGPCLVQQLDRPGLDAEELDLALLDGGNGVDVFTRWIFEKYLDKEVVKVGKCMLEFFKHLKKGYSQEIRDFNQEYDRQVSRLNKIGCNLPDLCLAWLYVDKLRLDNGEYDRQVSRLKNWV